MSKRTDNLEALIEYYRKEMKDRRNCQNDKDHYFAPRMRRAQGDLEWIQENQTPEGRRRTRDSMGTDHSGIPT